MYDKPVRVCDYSGWQAVHYASKLTDTSCLKALIDFDDTLVLSETKDKTTPLIVAAGLGNLPAVDLLLKYLSKTDILRRDLHGRNAIYYAIISNTESCTSVALSLLDNCKNILNVIDCLTDSIAFTAIRLKNMKVFQYLLTSGLDLRYSFEDDQYEYSDYKTPDTLMAQCVFFDWADGLQVLIEAEAQTTKWKPDFRTPRLNYLFRLSHMEKHCSAWHLVFYLGRTQCLELMLNHGMTLSLIDRNVDGEQINLLFPFPLCLTLENDIWGKRDFIKFFLSMQSCSVFDEGYKVTAQACYNVGYSNARKLVVHPLVVALESVLNECTIEEHSAPESVEMLLGCGFSFNFNFVAVNAKVDSSIYWCNSYQKLLELSLDDVRVYAVLATVLQRAHEFAITSHCFTASCILEANYINNKLSLDSLLQKPLSLLLSILSKRSDSEIISFSNTVCVVGNKLALTSGEGNNKRAFLNKTACHWTSIAHLLLKGFHAFPDEDVDQISFPMVFLRDNEKQKLGVQCKSNVSPFQQMCQQSAVSSLMNLCRQAIRNQIGVVRLIKEPVWIPDVISDHNLSHSSGVSNSTGVPSIFDQLKIPTTLKLYLQYVPELIKYADHCKMLSK